MTTARTSAVLRGTVLALTMLVTACASRPIHLGGDPGTTVLPAHELPAPEAADITLPGQPTYVGPGDRLVVDVYGMPDMSGREVVVDSEGQLSFSGAGRFEVYGKTAPEVADLLAARLRASYVRDPQVTVSIKESAGRLVTIEGQVTKPGIYPVANHMSLLRTMAVSGGLTEFARIDDIVVFRTVKGQRYAALYNLRAIREGAYADPDIYANDVVVVGDSTSRRLFKDILQVAPLLMTPLVVAVDRLSK